MTATRVVSGAICLRLNRPYRRSGENAPAFALSDVKSAYRARRLAATATQESPMTVRAGRELLAVPGPTNIPDEVLQAMHRPAVEIYSEPLIGSPTACSTT
jgi:hypothetical protein